MAGTNKQKALNAPVFAILPVETEWHEGFASFFPHAPECKAMLGDQGMRVAVGNHSA